MIKTILICLTVLVSVGSFAQGHFSVAFTGNGQDHMNLYILTATINGVNLEAGDEIAAFDGTICCGIVVLTQPINMTNAGSFVTIPASKVDNGILNGFTEGNTITYKFWDSSKSEEVSAITAEYRDIKTTQTITAPTYTANKSAFALLFGKVNQIPVANAGTDQSVNEGTTVTLNGSASSDADGNTLTYVWTVPSGITLSSTTTATPTFTAPDASTDTQYNFSLVVNDGKANSSTDQVIITVKQANNVPVANAGTDQTVNKGAIVTLNGSASADADKDLLTYMWTAPAGITLSSTSEVTPSFTAPQVTTNTQYALSLVVNDGKSFSQADVTIITVLAPVVIQVYPNPMTSGFQVSGLQGTGTLTMTNLRGKLCLRKQVTANEYISVKTLAKGYYILKIVHTNGTFEAKVLKK